VPSSRLFTPLAKSATLLDSVQFVVELHLSLFNFL